MHLIKGQIKELQLMSKRHLALQLLKQRKGDGCTVVIRSMAVEQVELGWHCPYDVYIFKQR